MPFGTTFQGMPYGKLSQGCHMENFLRTPFGTAFQGMPYGKLSRGIHLRLPYGRQKKIPNVVFPINKWTAYGS
jgi:hypothetical protein